jgi:N-acetylneuraminic acid mutarotase
MPTVRGEIGVGVVDGVLYAVGGNSGSGYDPTTILATVEAYDPATNAWTTRAPLPTPRAGLAVVVVDGILYAIGGLACQPPAGQPCVGGSPLAAVATVEAYAPATNSWTTRASLPTPRVYLAAAAIDGAIYAIGGQANDFPFRLTTVEAYNPSTDTWTARAPMPTGRFGLGVDVVNGVLYALSGEAGSFFEARAVEAYNPVSDVWTSLPLAPVGRRHLATTVLNGVIYLIGGDGGVELVETFRP